MPVHLARFHRPFCRGGTETWFTSHVFTDLSITVVPNSGPPRMVSLHFCAGGRSICPLRTVFQVHRSGWSGKDSHLARFHRLFCRGGTEAWSTSHGFTAFLCRVDVLPVYLARFSFGFSRGGPECRSTPHTFAHFSAFYPKRGLLFLVNYRSLLAFREETF